MYALDILSSTNHFEIFDWFSKG